MTYGYIYNLTSRGLIRPPSFLPEAVQLSGWAEKRFAEARAGAV